MTTLEKRVPCTGKHSRAALARGFSLIELLIATAVLTIVLAGIVQYIAVATQRSKIESTKVDLSQEGREFVDEFERDIHQAGYPNCRQFNVGACSNAANYNDHRIAAGLVSVSSTQIAFEGDVDGDGLVDSVRYQLVDSAGNPPGPGSTCPCTIQRSQVNKQDGNPLAVPPQLTPVWSQELQNLVNSGNPVWPAVYGGGLNISGTALFQGGAVTNNAYYAAVASFKDYPVFSAYDQNGNLVPLPQDITTPGGQAYLQCPAGSTSCIKSIRLTINLLGSGTTGYDTKTFVRPVVTLVGSGRMDN
jgi:prepilin-type N-terminal cleavage/methylation domain-containing protein